MAKTKKANTKLSGSALNWLKTPKNMLITVFVAGFAAVGIYMISSSSAYTYERTSGFGGYGCKTEPTLGKGNAGECVKVIQYGINNWIGRCAINTPKMTVDGIFGDKTVTGVKVFQTKHSLMADGIVGPKTWNAFFAEYAIWGPTGYCKQPANSK